jgi:hypothetical protein
MLANALDERRLADLADARFTRTIRNPECATRSSTGSVDEAGTRNVTGCSAAMATVWP